MINRSVLALSSLAAASLVSLAAAPAMAGAVDSARDLVANITPADNNWGSPCSVDFTLYTATTNGACFFTLSLRDDDPTISTALLSTWWGSTNPSAGIYYNQIGAGNHWTEITAVADIQEGDLLATSWTNTNGTAGGYVMIVDVAPAAQVPATRYLVSILDATQTPHGPTDSRWQADAGGIHDKGAGAGDIYIDADAVTDAIVAHTWSTVTGGTIYNQTGAGARPMRVGRFVR